MLGPQGGSEGGVGRICVYWSEEGAMGKLGAGIISSNQRWVAGYHSTLLAAAQPAQGTVRETLKVCLGVCIWGGG